MSGFLPERTIHVHVSRYCNLRCLHCYSTSGPDAARAALRSDLLLQALSLLRDEGYTRISLSGGEPLLYPEIEPLARGIAKLGYAASLVTNGVLLDGSAPLEFFDTVAVSLDGLAQTHNKVRANLRSFEWAMRGLDYLRSHGRRSAVALCVSKASLAEAPEVAYLALEKGASFLHVRPLVLAGRARSNAIEPLAPADSNRLLLIVLALRQELGVRLNVQLDLVHPAAAWAHRTQYDELLNSSKREQALLSDLVNPLVITDTGEMKPLTYDFPEAFDLCHISELSGPIIASIKHEKVNQVSCVVEAALARARNDEGLIDWFAYCTDEAFAWVKEGLHIQKEIAVSNLIGRAGE